MDMRDHQGISIHTGFPNPAVDKNLGSLDLNQLLVQNSSSTFIFRLRGNEWEELGIFDNDIAIVDRVLDPRKDDLVTWWNRQVDNFRISKYKDIEADATVWGVVTSVIHQLRKVNR